MLRKLLNEPERVDEGVLLAAFQAINNYQGRLKKKPYGRGKPAAGDEEMNYRLGLWAEGFIEALNELEESKYCAEKFAESIRSVYVEDMPEEELDEYRRHVYFYKNAFIRVFSVLDKLGYFMNERFKLRTEKIKPKFSYFTVLHRMHELGVVSELEQQLFDLKEDCSEPLQRLRNDRNMEIHHVNPEILDDILRAKHEARKDDRQRVENLKGNLGDLQHCFDMVCRTVELVFRYAKRTV